MKLAKQIRRILGVTPHELTVIMLLVLGLSVGGAVKYFFAEVPEQITYQDIYVVMDSLAEADKTTYIGSDIEQQQTIIELAQQDTVVTQEQLFPEAKKKQLPQSGEKINLNTASLKKLMKLPGIGEKTAQKIIEYRQDSPFTNIDDIMNVKGIGPKKFEKMKEFLRI